MKNSKIEWTDHTANLWWGCDKVHTGCKNCYAEYFSDTRYGNGLWGGLVRREIKKTFNDLSKWQFKASQENIVQKVFVGSMMDIFEKSMPLVDRKGNNIGWETGDLRQLFFAEVTYKYPNLLFLLLTKRPHNINSFIPDAWRDNPPKNVIFGTSVSDQSSADDLLAELIKVNGKKFVSIEPQVETISLMGFEKSLDWVIQGGESGHKKRHFSPDWARRTMMECNNAGIPYFFKQIDKVQPIPDDLQIREFPIINQ